MLRVNLPVVGMIHLQNNTFVTGVKNKATGDSKLNGNPANNYYNLIIIINNPLFSFLCRTSVVCMKPVPRKVRPRLEQQTTILSSTLAHFLIITLFLSLSIIKFCPNYPNKSYRK